MQFKVEFNKSNSRDALSDTIVSFQNLTYDLHAWSVSILPDCKNVVFDTAKDGRAPHNPSSPREGDRESRISEGDIETRISEFPSTTSGKYHRHWIAINLCCAEWSSCSTSIFLWR